MLDRSSPPVWSGDGGGTNCKIEEVVERLVCYKLFNGKTVRTPSTLGYSEVTAKDLKAMKAALMKG